MEKKRKLIIRYDNDLTKTPLKGLSVVDLNIFMYLLYICQDRGTEDVTIPLKVLRESTEYKTSNSQMKFMEDIYRMKQKMAGISVWARELKGPGTTTLLNVFSALTVDLAEKTLTVAVTKECAYLLNNNERKYTELEYLEYRSLKSIYSKNIYRQLRSWNSTGVWNASIEEFRDLVCIPDSYRTKDIEKRILKPAMAELEKFFDDIRYEKILDKKRGNPLKRIVIAFRKDGFKSTGLTCPYCGRPLIEKVINGASCWCHADGWKEGAPCSHIFNSVAEIKGYSEKPEDERKEEEPVYEKMPEEVKKKLEEFKEKLKA